MEELELALERNELVRGRIEVAVDRRHDNEVDVGRALVHAPCRHLAPELLDALVRRGLVGALGALGPLPQEGVHGARDGAAVVDHRGLGCDL
jgi:hypothetical protein